MRTVPEISRRVRAPPLRWSIASSAFAADDGIWSVSESPPARSGSTTGDVQQASLKTERRLEARRHHPHRPQRPRPAGPRRGEHPDRTEFGGRPARGKEGRSFDHHHAAGRLDPARGREEERQAFRGRDALSCRRGQRHAVPRHGDRLRHQRRRHPRPGRGRRLQIRPDRPGDAGSARPPPLRSGNAGLSLGGSGTLQPIEQGKPRASSVDRVPVPRNGLLHRARSKQARPGPHAASHRPLAAASPQGKAGVTRISSSLGEVRLNFHRVTHGLARECRLRGRHAKRRELRTTRLSGLDGSGSSSAGRSASAAEADSNGTAIVQRQCAATAGPRCRQSGGGGSRR